jgi:hypothetical protein
LIFAVSLLLSAEQAELEYKKQTGEWDGPNRTAKNSVGLFRCSPGEKLNKNMDEK